MDVPSFNKAQMELSLNLETIVQQSSQGAGSSLVFVPFKHREQLLKCFPRSHTQAQGKRPT